MKEAAVRFEYVVEDDHILCDIPTWNSSEEQNFDLAKLIFIRVWYVHADPINFI